MALTDLIETRPGVRSGKPRFIGTRITVDDVLEYVASGMSAEAIVADFPELTVEHVGAALASDGGWGTRCCSGARSPRRRQPAGVVGSLDRMATGMNLGPELRAVVERAREHARASGELLDGPGTPPPSDGLSAAARAAVADWVDSGDYDRAVAEIVAGDPDLGNQ